MRFELVSTQGAANIYGAGVARVHQLVKAGRLQPAMVTPLGRLFAAEDVRRLAAERDAALITKNNERPADANG